MNTLHIPKTDSTPSVLLDSKSKSLTIDGRSISSNPDSFYQRLEDLIDRYFKKQNSLKCTISLEYFNSSSSRSLWGFLKIIEQHAVNGKNVSVHWLHDSYDDDSVEFAEDLQRLLKIPIQIVAIDN